MNRKKRTEEHIDKWSEYTSIKESIVMEYQVEEKKYNLENIVAILLFINNKQLFINNNRMCHY